MSSPTLHSLQRIIFNISSNSVNLSIIAVRKYLDPEYGYSVNQIISILIYSAFCSNSKEDEMYLDYIKLVDRLEKELHFTYTLIYVFSQYLLGIQSQEADFLLARMIDQEMISSNLVLCRKTYFLAHVKENRVFYNKENVPFANYFEENVLESIQSEGWDYHKSLALKGVNTNELTQFVREDDERNLRETLTSNKFTGTIPYNIEPDLFERCSYINDYSYPLIFHAAYFGSIKCFKTIKNIYNDKFNEILNETINNKDLEAFAVAGGNYEIIDLCKSPIQQSVYESAVRFHRDEIFYRLFVQNNMNLSLIGNSPILCVRYGNFDVLTFLEDNGLKITNELLEEAFLSGNIFLVNYFLVKLPLPENAFLLAVKSGNVDLVEYILKRKDVLIGTCDEFL